MSVLKQKGTIRFLSINGLCLLLSLIGLIWGDWEVVVSLGCGVVFAFASYITMALNVADKDNSSSKIYVFAILRYIFMILAVVIPGVILYFTQSEADTKYRYLNILAATVPFLLNIMFAAMFKPEEEISKKEQDK